jgi:hypothetical protein
LVPRRRGSLSKAAEFAVDQGAVPLRTHLLIALTGAAISASALAADVPLSVLNGGPSSDAIPSASADPVACIVAPREIVDPSISTNLPIATLDGNSLLVQDAASPTASGVRNRSRAVMAVFDVNNANPPLLQVQASLDFDPTVADSYFLFLNADDAANINTMGELDAFIVNGTQFVDYRQVFLDDPGFSTGSGAGGDFTDSDILASAMSAGIAFRANNIAHTNFELGLLVFAAPGQTSVPTEYFCVRQNPNRVAPNDAAFLGTNDRIRVYADSPLVADGGDTLSPSDTFAAALDGDDFRVRVNGVGASQTLTEFLINLDSPRAVASVAVIGEYSDILEITLDAPVAQSDVNLVLSSVIGFSAETANGSVYSFAGEDPDPNLATFQSMTRRLCPTDANADTNFDGIIDFTDLNAVLSSFGQTGSNPVGDVNNDNVVNFADLNIVLGAYGTVCE